MKSTGQDVEVVADRERAEVLLHPLRLRVLGAARSPASATEIARRLDIPPQKVNYHVRRLEEHGFLRKVEERRARNLVEKVYAATARSYVLASAVLGELAPGVVGGEEGTPSRWLALQARAETELGEVLEGTAPGRGEAGEGAPTVCFEAEVRFESPQQRALFARTLGEVVNAVVSKYGSPSRTTSGERGVGRPFRLILGLYPVPERDAP